MKTSNSFNELMRFQQDTEALSSIAGRLGWDQETMMPRGSTDQRATEQAAIVKTIHSRNVDPRISEWIGKIRPQNEIEEANIRLIKKNYQKACKVPSNFPPSRCKLTVVQKRQLQKQRKYPGAKSAREEVSRPRNEERCPRDGSGAQVVKPSGSTRETVETWQNDV